MQDMFFFSFFIVIRAQGICPRSTAACRLILLLFTALVF
jgi:hypothetical protein